MAYGPCLKPSFLPMCSLPCTPRPPVSYSSDGCLRHSLLPDAGRLKLKSLAHFPGSAIHLPLNPMRDPYAEKMGSWRRIRKHIMIQLSFSRVVEHEASYAPDEFSDWGDACSDAAIDMSAC
ncbi:hypothetical protein BKA56DRAFT_625788 [Ilyonectria sp. MPI-CAGE-AT-0026]|nr:hypothetical protein BKA56DRAFT_625788 [Ilyonectria sp. MPI-CAGE-AT-0026]